MRGYGISYFTQDWVFKSHWLLRWKLSLWNKQQHSITGAEWHCWLISPKDHQWFLHRNAWNPKYSSILILYGIEVARRTPISRGSDTNTVTQLLLRNVAAWCISSISSVRFIDLRTLNLGQNKKDLYILTCMYHVSMHKISFDVMCPWQGISWKMWVHLGNYIWKAFGLQLLYA